MFFKKKQKELDLIAEQNAIERGKLEVEKRKLKMQEAAYQYLNAETSKPLMDYRLPEIPPVVIPNGEQSAIAMDSCGIQQYVSGVPRFASERLSYAELSAMSQSSDYRCVSETTSSEMTRAWGKVKSKGDGDEKQQKKIEKIEERLKSLNIKSKIQKLIELELIFGRSQLFIDLKGSESTLDNPLQIDSKSLSKGCLKGFHVIEPVWTTPSAYNAINAIEDDFFKVNKWFVLGKEIHNDRLITLIMRPVSDMLKPVYNFGGVSMYQLMKPYVERWQRTVDSVSELIHTFSVTGLKTDMDTVLGGGSDSELIHRAALFTKLKNNQGLMLFNESEELFQVNTPLSSLDSLLQKSQEQMAAPSHTPLVKLLGITPSGLNANSEGEIRVYNDYISSLQEAHIKPIMEKIIHLIQIDLYGDIDDKLMFVFKPLEQMNDEQMAIINKTNAERDALYRQNGVLSAEEIRKVLANNEDGDFSGIDVEDVPEDEGYGYGENQEEQAAFNDT